MVVPERGLRLSDERGAVQFYMVCAAAALAGLLLLVVNTGTHTTKKVEFQNTTDAAVYSGAAWISRGLNVISMLNVIQANTLAIALSLPAFDRAMTVAIPILHAEFVLCEALTVGIGSAACVLFEYAAQAMQYFQRSPLWQTPLKTATAPDGLLWKTMKGLGEEADLVRKLTPGLAEVEVIRIAIANDKTRAALIVSRSESGGLTLMPTMPAKVGAFQDLCDATRRPLYPSSKSPIDSVTDVLVGNPVIAAYNFVTGFRYIFRAFLNAQYAQYCNGPASSTKVPKVVDSFAECEAKNGEARWSVGTFELELRPTFVEATQDLDRNTPSGERTSSRTFSQDCSWRPPGEVVPGSGGKKYKTGYVRTVGSADAPAYRAVVTFYQAGALTVDDEADADKAPSGGDWKPKPVVLIDDGSDRSNRGARARLEYMAVAVSHPTQRLGGVMWESPLGDTTYAYGSARTFNPTTFDLFTQNWRAKLVPASHLENGLLSASADGANPGRDASPLLVLKNLQQFIALLNNH